MTDTMNRIAIRPLSRILPARLRGEDPIRIEKENLKIRHDQMRDVESKIKYPFALNYSNVCLYLYRNWSALSNARIQSTCRADYAVE